MSTCWLMVDNVEWDLDEFQRKINDMLEKGWQLLTIYYSAARQADVAVFTASFHKEKKTEIDQ